MTTNPCPRIAVAALLASLLLLSTSSAQIELLSEARVDIDSVAASVQGVSGDGRYVVFSSRSTQVVAGQVDATTTDDVFVMDRNDGSVALVSHDGDGVTAIGAGNAVVVSKDGSTVVFQTQATPTGFVDGNAGALDIFAYDVATGALKLISRSTAGAAQGGDGDSLNPRVSDDGSRVVFQSRSSDLIASFSDQNGNGTDVYVFDCDSTTMTLVSRSATSATTGADAEAIEVFFSGNGARVAYHSRALNLITGYVDGSGSGIADAFLHDISSATTSLINFAAGTTTTSSDSTVRIQSIDNGGTRVLYRSGASDLITGFVDNNFFADDVFLYDSAAGSTQLISRTPSSAVEGADGFVGSACLSGDASAVILVSRATNLVTGFSSTNFNSDIFLHDVASGVTTLLSGRFGSATESTDRGVAGCSVSDDGSLVIFASDSPELLAGVDNEISQIFAYDVAAGALFLVSVAADGASPGDASNNWGPVSADGSLVVFSSTAKNLVTGIAPGGRPTIYGRTSGGSTSLLAPRAGATGSTADGDTQVIGMSADGRIVLLVSKAPNIADNQVGVGDRDHLYLLDRQDRGDDHCGS